MIIKLKIIFTWKKVYNPVCIGLLEYTFATENVVSGSIALTSFGSLQKCSISGTTPDLLNKNRCFSNIPNVIHIHINETHKSRQYPSAVYISPTHLCSYFQAVLHLHLPSCSIQKPEIYL